LEVRNGTLYRVARRHKVLFLTSKPPTPGGIGSRLSNYPVSIIELFGLYYIF
jgi:hypothetical protein